MNLREFIGQKKLKSDLLAIMNRNRWSVILRGHYGYGKTTLALLVAGAIGLYTRQIPAMGRIRTTTNIINIVDECHTIRERDFGRLYELMSRNNFIFCTNMASRLPEPFMNRNLIFRMQPYSIRELSDIIRLHASEEGNFIEPEVSTIMAERCKGTPRTGVMMYQKYQAICRGRSLDYTRVLKLLEEDGIDENGLNQLDRIYLNALSSGPKSFNTLSSILDIDKIELSRLEHYLIHRGFVEKTSRGRALR